MDITGVGRRSVGVMEWWSDGVMEYWSIGVLGSLLHYSIYDVLLIF